MTTPTPEQIADPEQTQEDGGLAGNLMAFCLLTLAALWAWFAGAFKRRK